MDPLHRYPERDIITTIKPVIWKTGIRTYPDPEIPKGNLLGLNNRILDNSRTAFFQSTMKNLPLPSTILCNPFPT